MTMYITVATTEKIIQVSDRRITRYINGKPRYEDTTNKVVIGHFKYGYFSIAYCGLAECNGVATPDVFVNKLRKAAKKSISLKTLIDNFTNELTLHYKSIKTPKKDKDFLRTSLSLAGYTNRGVLFYTRISNFEDSLGNPGSLRDEFSWSGKMIASPTFRDKKKGFMLKLVVLLRRKVKDCKKINYIG